MKTEIKVTIRSDMESLVFGYWDEEQQEFIPLDGTDKDVQERAAELFGCTPALIEALIMFAEQIVDVVGLDLRDIWRRLDNAKIK